MVLGPADVRGPYLTRFVVCLVHCGVMAALLAATGIAFDGKKAVVKDCHGECVVLSLVAGLFITWAMLATFAGGAVGLRSMEIEIRINRRSSSLSR